ncbi:MAG: NUDIX domain-containing protein [Candidatus Nitrosocaldus sp.]
MLEERSAGAVLFRLEDREPIYLILHYGAGHWDFPKGNIEQGEDELSTVKREIREETCIDDIEFIQGFRRMVEYMYKRAGRLVHKVVVFYLAKTSKDDVKLSYEHNDYRWSRFDDALDLLTYNNSKIILKDADSFLRGILSSSSSSS